jgi:hypothetical protein
MPDKDDDKSSSDRISRMTDWPKIRSVDDFRLPAHLEKKAVDQSENPGTKPEAACSEKANLSGDPNAPDSN